MPEATQTLPPARPAGFSHDMTRVLETSPPSAANSQTTTGPVTGPNLADPPAPPPLAKDPDNAAVARPAPSLDPIATWLFDGHLNDESILAALQGDKLQDRDKRHLVDLALANFSHLAFDKINQLAILVRDPSIDPSVRRLVAERLLQRAVDPGDAAENPRAQARAFALDFVLAMGDDSRGMAELLAPPNLSPKDGFSLARALGKEPLPDTHLMTPRGRLEDPRLNDATVLSGSRDRILAAVPQLAGTPAAITAVVYGLWDEITPSDFQCVPGLAHNLAVAVADQWDPNNPPVDRVEGLLTSWAGVRLMCEGSSSWRAAVHEAFRLNSRLTAATLERYGGDPESNPEVAAEVTKQLVSALHGGRVTVPTAMEAEENAAEIPGTKLVTEALQTPSGRKLLFNDGVPIEYRRKALQTMLAHGGRTLKRADFEHTSNAWRLPGIAGPFAAQKIANVEAVDFSSLTEIGRKNLIGLWLGKDPAADIRLTDQDFTAAQQALARGEIPPYLNEKDFYPDNKDVQQFAGTDRLAVEQMMLFNDGPVPIAVLHGRMKNGREFYIDQGGSVYWDGPRVDKPDIPDLARAVAVGMRYRAIENFLEGNDLPEGGTLYFRDPGDKARAFVLDHRDTPAERDTTGKVAHVGARAVTTGAFIASFFLTDGLSAAVLGYLGYLGMGYQALEGANRLFWLAAHGHDVNPFTNPDQALVSTWLDMGANALPPVARVGGLAAAGVLSAEKAVLVTAGLELTAKGTNLAALANECAELVNNPGSKPEDWLKAGVYLYIITARHAPHRPADATPRPLEMPITRASAPPEPAQPTPAPARVPNPGGRSPGPIDHDGLPVVNLRQPLGQRLWGKFVPPNRGTSDTAPHPVEPTWGLRGTQPWTLPKELPAKHRRAGEAPPSPRLASGTAQHEVGPTRRSWALPGPRPLPEPRPPPELPPGFVPSNAAGHGPAGEAHAGAPAPAAPPPRPAGNRNQPERRVAASSNNGAGSHGPIDHGDRLPVPDFHGEELAEPATAPPADPKPEIERLEKRLDDAQRVYQLQLELQGAQRTTGKRAFGVALEAYERARFSLEIKRNPYPQSTPLDPFREVDAPMEAFSSADKNYSRALREGRHSDIDESLGKRNAAYEKARDALSKAEKEYAIRNVTPESMVTVERAAAKARTDYDAALQTAQAALQKVQLPDSVSIETVEAYNKARDAYQKANDAVVKMWSSPQYWEYRTAELGTQTEAAENELRKANVQKVSEMRWGHVSEGAQARVDKALAEYRDAAAAEKRMQRTAADVSARYDSKHKEYQDRLGHP